MKGIAYLFILCFFLGFGVSNTSAATHALIVVGLAGENEEWKEYHAQAEGWKKLLISNGVEEKHLQIIYTPETKTSPTTETTRDAVKAHLRSWTKNLTEGDDAILILIGYSVTKQGHFQFQVRGPRLKESDFVESLSGLHARSLTVFLPGSGGVGLAKALAGSRRVIISATAEETEINETQFGHFWLETATEDPKASILELLRKTDRKVVNFYQMQHLARPEVAKLWVGAHPPVEAPFNLPIEKNALTHWTFANLSISSKITTEVASTTPPSPTISHPKNTSQSETSASSTEFDLESDQRPVTRPSTPEELTFLKNAPPASKYPGASGLILLRSVSQDIAADLSTHEVFEYRILVFHTRLRSLLDRLIETPEEGNAQILRLKTILPSGKTIEMPQMNNSPATLSKKESHHETEVIPLFAPGVTPGCIVDYTIETHSPPPPNLSYYDEIPLFDVVPTRELNISISWDKKVPLATKCDRTPFQEAKQPDSPYAYSKSWTWRDLPAAIQEPHADITAKNNPTLALSSYHNWKEFGEWVRRLTRDTRTSSKELQDTALFLTQRLTNEPAKIQALYNYVSSLRYNTTGLGSANACRPHTAASVLARQYGDCKDKANLLIALLHEVSIQARFALVARARPFDETFPGFQFNHAVAVIPKKNELFWLDATDESCPFGMLPPGDVGQKALVFDEKREIFQTIDAFHPNYDSTVKCDLELELREGSAMARGKVKIHFAGYPDYQWRSLLHHGNPSEAKRTLAYHLTSCWPGTTIEAIRFEEPDSLNKPLDAEIDLAIPVLDQEANCIRPPGPLFPWTNELDPWERKSSQQLNHGYPMKLEQNMILKVDRQTWNALKSKIENPISDKLDGILAYQVTTQLSNQSIIRHTTFDLLQPTLSVQNTPTTRKKIEAWVSATQSSLPLNFTTTSSK